MPIYTVNPADFQGIDGLTVSAIPHPVTALAREANPCIELWFILHIEDQTAAIERHTAQRRSAELLGCDKNLTIAATELLYELHDQARGRAQGLDAKHDGDGSPQRSNPSSDVWRLIDHARSLKPPTG